MEPSSRTPRIMPECVPEGVDFYRHTKSYICSLLQFKIHGFEVQTPDVRQISSA